MPGAWSVAMSGSLSEVAPLLYLCLGCPKKRYTSAPCTMTTRTIWWLRQPNAPVPIAWLPTTRNSCATVPWRRFRAVTPQYICAPWQMLAWETRAIDVGSTLEVGCAARNDRDAARKVHGPYRDGRGAAFLGAWQAARASPLGRSLLRHLWRIGRVPCA